MVFRKVCWLVPMLFVGVLRAAAADRAVVTTTDYSSGSLSVLDLTTNLATSNLLTIHSDAVVTVHNGKVYVINRLGQDNILVLDGTDLSKPPVQYSVGNGTNPQDIAFASDQKAYVARLQAPNLLIVNPATGDSLGSIGLPAFADADGMAEPAQLAIYNGRLYVTCQRLDQNNAFAPSDYSAIAVIDLATDQVVDVDSTQSGVQGIRLATKDPVDEVLVGNHLYLSSVGAYTDFADGGIERVNLDTNKTEGVVLSEADLGGNVGSLAVSGAVKGYVVVSDQNYANTVQVVDLVNKRVTGALSGVSGGYIPDIAVFKGKLYVADQGAFGTAGTTGVRIYDAASDAPVAGPISTGLPPSAMAFLGDPLNAAAARADFDGSGAVDFSDFLAFAAAFGGEAPFNPKFDLNDDGMVSFPDFLLFVAVFGQAVSG